MPVRCPKCKAKHDVAEFDLGGHFKCACGFELDVSLIRSIDDFVRSSENQEERKKAEEIKDGASEICRMILDERTQKIDIELAKQKLKEKVTELFPDKVQTYEMIYEARFERLWEQFRDGA